MSNKSLILLPSAFLFVLLVPSVVDAYGAAHVGYTRVTPTGVYHTGETKVAGPGGVYETGHTTAAGYGGVYHGGYEAAAVGGVRYGYGGGYAAPVAPVAPVYAPSYSNGYGYVR